MLNRILQTGTKDITDPYLMDRIYLSNIVALLSLMIGVTYAIFDFCYGNYNLLIVALGAVFLAVVAIFLNKIKYNTLSRIFAGMNLPILVTIYGAFINHADQPSMGISAYATVVFFIFPFILFDLREKHIVFPILLLYVLISTTQELYLFKIIEVNIHHQLFLEEWFIYLSYFITSLVFVVVIYFSLKRMYETDIQKELLMTSVNEKSNELLVQNEELQQQQEEIITQNEYIERKNIDLFHEKEQTRKSIISAKIIQNSILPDQSYLRKILGRFFVIYMPKDIVSGDFYWTKKIKDKSLIIVGDCTGHGVRGALMTIMGKTLLDNLINNSECKSPGRLLSLLNISLINTLQEQKNNTKAGIDMAIVSMQPMEENTTEVTFSGAKRPLFFIENNKIRVIKGDRFSIGDLSKNEFSYSDQTVVVKNGTMMYLFSDGYSDQNNHLSVCVSTSFLEEPLHRF